MAGTCYELNYGEMQNKASRSAKRMITRHMSFDLTVESEKRRKVDFEFRTIGKTKKSETENMLPPSAVDETDLLCPKFGKTSVCGRRRDMEDAVSIHPSLCRRSSIFRGDLHFFGVFDGHGCSHVATRCRDRMHEIVKDEVENGGDSSWENMMRQSFEKMDNDNTEWSSGAAAAAATFKCRCEMVTPQCEAVGSTAVVAVVSADKVIVSNCGDSRAVLCRKGVALPLSVDHKPDRPDELQRIEASGGRVIFWDGARVSAVLAMSRAIGDNYLKPYVIPVPEVTITDRTAEDECLILASDGLWDVVSNKTACKVARMCLKSDRGCSVASILLTRLALARQSSDNVSVVVVDLRRQK